MKEATPRAAKRRLPSVTIDDAKRELSGGEKQNDRDERREQRQEKSSRRRNGLVYRVRRDTVRLSTRVDATRRLIYDHEGVRGHATT